MELVAYFDVALWAVLLFHKILSTALRHLNGSPLIVGYPLFLGVSRSLTFNLIASSNFLTPMQYLADHATAIAKASSG